MKGNKQIQTLLFLPLLRLLLVCENREVYHRLLDMVKAQLPFVDHSLLHLHPRRQWLLRGAERRRGDGLVRDLV